MDAMLIRPQRKLDYNSGLYTKREGLGFYMHKQRMPKSICRKKLSIQVLFRDRCKVSQEYKMKQGSTHRRRAKRFGCFYENVDRIVVFERDGWACYLCGQPTPKEKMGTKEHDAPEQEHVIPLSHGVSHCYANVRCACHACNKAKGIAERRIKRIV